MGKGDRGRRRPVRLVVGQRLHHHGVTGTQAELVGGRAAVEAHRQQAVGVDHEADLAWLLFTDWGLSEYQGLQRLDGTPGREETIERYQSLTGLPVRNLRYNEVLAAVALACPVSRLETRFREDGLLTDDVDLVGFCVERINQLLD